MFLTLSFLLQKTESFLNYCLVYIINYPYKDIFLQSLIKKYSSYTEVKCTEDNPEEVCDINAVCLYSACHCLPGFRGDGKICAGIFLNC